MADFLMDYGLFLAKTVTVVALFLAVAVLILVLVARARGTREEHIEIKKLNDRYDEVANNIKQLMATKDEAKQLEKEFKHKLKEEDKRQKEESRSRIFVLDFDGDIKASEVFALREEITAVLMVARDKDEVFVRLHSAGGMVHAYGLAASQLARIKQKKIPLTISVDKVAASGGYMMACIADRIIAAPFAIVGSIGVVAQIPNFNRLLKKHDVDYELITAGEFKRTLTVFGENTDKAREKFKEEIEDTHSLFKEFVVQHRPGLDIGKVATGEHWFGIRALTMQLVDELQTSDDYLLEKATSHDLYEVKYTHKKPLATRISDMFSTLVERLYSMLWQKQQESRLP